MAATIVQATHEHLADVREIFWEYLQWANGNLQLHFGIEFDIAAMLEHDVEEIAIFMPPQGRLLLALDGAVVAGCACLRTQHPQIAELKRMYVRPNYRGQGIGRALVAALMDAVRQAGYRSLRLDSARFMHEAHALYRSLGFVERAPYSESDIPQQFHEHWIFMERSLIDDP